MADHLVELSYQPKTIKGDTAMNQLNSTIFAPDRERGQHLRFEDRCSIKVFRKLVSSLRRIAAELNCFPSTVMNELRRGTGKRQGVRGRNRGYSAKRCQTIYETNRLRCRKSRKLKDSDEFIQWVVKQVKNKPWSFDACVGFARKNRLFPDDKMVCTKTLYNKLWDGSLTLTPFDIPEVIQRNTRRRPPRKNKRVYGAIIAARPEIASARTECGYWEIYTVLGRQRSHESVVLTLVEKKTDYYFAVKIPGKDPQSVLCAMETLREEYGAERFARVFKTITADNGNEFLNLAKNEDWGVKVYFTHPYSSWDRP